MEPLTDKQQAILDFIEHEQARSGIMPSTREIQEHFGFLVRNVRDVPDAAGSSRHCFDQAKFYGCHHFLGRRDIFTDARFSCTKFLGKITQ